MRWTGSAGTRAARAADPLVGMRDRGGELLSRPEDLVTGEAVVLDLRPASFATRTLAILLDMVLTVVLLVLVFWIFTGPLALSDAAASSAIGLVLVVGVVVGIPVAVETITRGRSLGKLAAGLRVVRDDGGPIRFRHALVRGLLAVPEFWMTLGGVALIASLANPRGKRIGDLLAGTYVVRERTPAPLPPPPPMPPWLAGWAAATDLGRIPDGPAIAVRQFLARAGSLHPGSRQRLGAELAEQISRYVAPPPPAGTPAEAFLAAVMAERRSRDLARLNREAAAREARETRRREASPLSAIGSRLVGEDSG